MKKLWLTAGLLLHLFAVSAQSQKDTVLCMGLPKVQTPCTIKNFFFSDSLLTIPADSLNKGFKIITACPKCRIIGFKLSTDCDACQIIETAILGDAIYPNGKYGTILRHLKKGVTLYLECINIEVGGKKYLARSFAVRID